MLVCFISNPLLLKRSKNAILNNIIIPQISRIVKIYNRCMISSAILQIIATITMTIDHIGYYLLPNCIILRIIGRLAFPIFAFMLVEGFKHTHSRNRYFMRLIITAAISQVLIYLFSSLYNYNYDHNVIFTFAFAFITLICAEQGGFYLVAVPLLVLAAGALECEYGIYGAILVLGYYYANRVFADRTILRIMAYLILLTATMSSLALENNWAIQIFGIFAIIPIALYSGKKGRRLPRLFGYIFYPAHLAVFLLIKLLFF